VRPSAEIPASPGGDAESDARERELAALLAKIGAELLRCRDEQSVLARAADALLANGYASTFLLIREGDPLLEYGPSRGPNPEVRGVLTAGRPPRAVLERFNPHFSERRAAFFQRTEAMVQAAYAPDAAKRISAALPGNRTVQAPLFVDDAPYGAMVVTDDRLTPVACGTLEIFAQLVGAAVENARLHERAAARLAELSRLQSELVQRERLAALGEAAAVMAHEVRNPIAAILNAVTLLRRHPHAGASTEELHAVIAEEAERLDRIVGDLLAMGRPMIPRPRTVSLADVAEGALSILRSRKEVASCVLDPVVVEGDPHAHVDADLVLLAVLNVVRNAVQASPEGGRVRITVRAEDAARLLVVEDQGPGLSDEIAKRMFEPFFTTRATGTGIGLAVVRRIIDAHGGGIEVGRRDGGGGRIALRFAAPSGED
jgi:signal transduction histidine kinase